MKSQGGALIAEKISQNVTTFWLVNLGDTYFYTDCDESISYGGDTYVSYPLEVDGLKSGTGSPINDAIIRLGNVELEQSAAILNGTYENLSIFIYEAWLDSDGTMIDAETAFAGKVDGKCGVDEQWATIVAAQNLNPWTKRFPPRLITRKDFTFIPPRGTIFEWRGTTFTFR